MSFWWLLLAIPFSLLALVGLLAIIGAAFDEDDSEFGGHLTVTLVFGIVSIAGWVGVST